MRFPANSYVIAVAALALAPGPAKAESAPAVSETTSVATPSHEASISAQTQASAEGLVRDIDRIVAIEESAGWFVDELEFVELYPATLESVCRAMPSARTLALALLASRRERAGDPRRLFAAAGNELTSEVEHALTEERSYRALERGIEGAAEHCPFWIVPSPDFEGRQGNRNRWTLSVETGGLLQLRRTAGFWTFGGGGTGRLLPGYGFGGNFSILAGIEFGGGAMLEPGAPETEFVVNYFPALPVVARFHGVLWQYEIEMASVALFQSDDTDLSYGLRGGFALGIAALRRRNFLPWAGGHIAYEYYFEGDRPAAHFIRGGIRVGIMWDP